MNRFCLALIFAGLMRPLLFAQIFQGYPAIKNFLPTDYHGGPQVWSIVQDKYSLIYAAMGEAGLAVYDGVSWKTVLHPREYGIYALYYDKSEHILYYGGIYDFGILTSGEGGRLRFQSLADSPQIKKYLNQDGVAMEVRDIQSTSGSVLFQSHYLLFQYFKRDGRVKVHTNFGSGRYYPGFVTHDTYYTQLLAKGKGLYRLSGDTLIHVNGGEALEATSIQDALETAPHEVLMVLDSKLLHARVSGDSLLSVQPMALTPSGFLTQNTLNTAAKLGSGVRLVGSDLKGAALIDSVGNILTYYNESTGLESSDFTKIYEDNNRNIWGCLNIGIAKIDPGLDLSLWNKRSGLIGQVLHIFRYQDLLYLATSQSAYALTADGEIHSLGEEVFGTQNWMFTTIQKHGVTQVLLVNNRGMYEVNGFQAKKVIELGWCSVVHQSKLRPQWVLANRFEALVGLAWESTGWHIAGEFAGVSGDFRNLIEMTDGTLWASTYDQGLLRIVPGKENYFQPLSVTYFSEQHGLPSRTRLRVFNYGDEVLVTSPSGIWRYNKSNNKFEPHEALGKPLSDGSVGVLQMTMLGDTAVFVTPITNQKTPPGIWSLTAGRWINQPFLRLPQLTSIATHWIDNDGTIWIGSELGLFRYRATYDYRDYNQKFDCLIRSVAVNDSIFFHGWGSPAKYVMPYADHNLHFEFAAPFYDKEENTLYSHRLVGFENAWSTWSDVTMKEYSNLFEGDYTFEVKAKNIYGIESSVGTFFFHVLPPWYRTWWAYALYAVGFSLLLVVIVRERTRKLKRDKVLLSQMVEERTMALHVSEEELRQNLEELETTMENLRLTQNQLINSEKMASLGQLTAGIAHEINNPLNFISGGVQALDTVTHDLTALAETLPEEPRAKLQGSVEEIADMMGVILSGIERTSKIIKSLRVFSNPNEGIPTEVNLNVNDCIEGALTIMASKIKENSIVIRNHTSEVPLIRGNASMINQVLINLLDNAIQAFENIQRSERIITIRSYRAEKSVFITVQDNASGIPAKIQSQVMNPFFTSKDVGKGTGLGLSISYGIIEKHGGSLTFTSEEGVGTEFRIELPI